VALEKEKLCSSRLTHCPFLHPLSFVTLPTDIYVLDFALEFISVDTRMPLKFGTEVLSSVTCARVKVRVKNKVGKEAEGWGETPLSVQWVWPSDIDYSIRHQTLVEFCKLIQNRWQSIDKPGHCVEIGHDLIMGNLPRLLQEFNNFKGPDFEPMPWLAALVCASAFDLAIHDAYGVVNDVPIYQAYGEQFLSSDLSNFLEPAKDLDVDFRSKYPSDFLDLKPQKKIPVWHLVGGLDPLDEGDLTGSEPDDGYPVHLREWISRDGLNCLKIKLRGNDSEWDYERLVRIGEIANELGVQHLTTDFNCTVTDPAYVNEILDRLKQEESETFRKILYVEQPFPYDLEKNCIDVYSVAQRKPLFMDESAHDWKHVRLGRELGWTGVALKTCKTQTGALLSLCWARAHGMDLMVQDLTNPMLAQIPHVLLGAHAGTIMGVESNGMQFYPDASRREASIHPGIYQRRGGALDLSTIKGAGFGYRISEMK
jgi:L-alanine-DL-glutamate epimerase-like enolase superfamily enzyme